MCGRGRRLAIMALTRSIIVGTAIFIFSDTFATPMAGLRTPLSRLIAVLKARTERARIACDRTDFWGIEKEHH